MKNKKNIVDQIDKRSFTHIKLACYPDGAMHQQLFRCNVYNYLDVMYTLVAHTTLEHSTEVTCYDMDFGHTIKRISINWD